MCVYQGRKAEMRLVQGSRGAPDPDVPAQLPMGQVLLNSAGKAGGPVRAAGFRQPWEM